MSYQLKKVRLLSYKLHAAFSPSAHFRPKKAPRAIFSRGGGRVYFGVNGQFLCLGGPSYGHWKTMRVVLKNFFDLTPLSPYPILRCQNLILANWANMSVNSFSEYQIAWITGDQSGVVKHSYAQLVAQFVASEGSRATKPGCIQEIQIQTC